MSSNIEKKKLSIHGYEICPLPTGIFGLDGGAMFGTVPKVLWEKNIPADDKNRIPMEARALLLKKSGHNVLIDCGNGSDFIAKYGDKLGSKFQEMYNVDDSGPSLLNSLALYGLKPEDIHHVILTHLHFDHAGGGTTAKNGQLVPTFPQAQYYIQRRNLETAQNPNLRERASYFPANYQPLIEAGCLKILDGETENLLPGIGVSISDGHTQGQQIVKVSDNQNSLLYCADLIPTSSHVRLAWVMGYDLHPMMLIEEKQQILKQAAEKKWYLFFEHDPFCDAALVQTQGADFAVAARLQL
jgi:glyoxylase-like metal-dependent hydrolase (beta-lactamase superfamily II)